MSGPSTIALTAALLVDPPFTEQVQLLGSGVFDRENWEVTEVQASTVRMTGTGLQFIPVSDADWTTAQYNPRFGPAAGKVAWARFRIFFDHPHDIESKFGFWSTDANPFSGEPDVSAYFHVKDPAGGEDQGELFFVTKSSGGSANSVDLEEVIGEHDVFDFVIQINGTTDVAIWWKEAAETSWSSDTFDSDLPDQAVRYSIAAINVEAPAGNIQAFVFELDADR